MSLLFVDVIATELLKQVGQGVLKLVNEIVSSFIVRLSIHILDYQAVVFRTHLCLGINVFFLIVKALHRKHFLGNLFPVFLVNCAKGSQLTAT